MLLLILCLCRILTSWVRVETSPQHAPVSSLSWSPQGNFLVSASPSDTSLITWDIPMGVGTRMKRTKGGGLTFVSWSPDGLRVFAASVSSVFRVWETQNWTCEMWTHLSGRCKVGRQGFLSHRHWQCLVLVFNSSHCPTSQGRVIDDKQPREYNLSPAENL